MLFNSFSFIFVFLPIALAGFFLVSRLGRAYAAAWLMLASFVFYGMWNPRYVLLLLISISFNFIMGELIHASAGRPGRQKALLTFGVGCNVLALVYYKYLFSLLGFANSVGIAHLHVLPMVLPLGISFFTFTQIGYLVDVQQDMARERGLLNYVLFVTFFPHLIAGPILHNGEIMPQFAESETYRFSPQNFMAGIVIFIIGLAKKCLLADPISANVHAGFADPSHLQLFAAWFTMLCFCLQLYFDFSGYTDMAIGIARMFNIRFPINFNSPYKATSMIEHWHRWHMTLSRFLNQYLFNPIAFAVARYRAKHGMKVNKTAQKRPIGFLVMVAFPLMVTMTLAGAWHGAGLTFLIFGLLHGFYLTVNHAWRLAFPPTDGKRNPLVVAASFMLTFLCVLVAMIFFRSPNLPTAMEILGGMTGMHGLDWASTPFAAMMQLGSAHMQGVPNAIAFAKMLNTLVKNTAGDAWVVLCCVIVWGFPNTQQLMSHYDNAAAAAGRAILNWRPTIGWAAAIGAMCAVALLAISGTTEFLYYQF